LKTAFTNQLLKYMVILLAPAFRFLQVKAQTETLPTGSFIINRGATNTNTHTNVLRPYGLLYHLIRNINVPIKWVIGVGKIKTGVHVAYNGAQYRGGTFPLGVATHGNDGSITLMPTVVPQLSLLRLPTNQPSQPSNAGFIQNN
jgi:hypothetical protein